MSLTVVAVRGVAHVVELPKSGLRAFGVPEGGPFDVEAHRFANAALGNDPYSAALECSGSSIELLASQHTVIAVVGCRALNAVRALTPGKPLSVVCPRGGFRYSVSTLGGCLPLKGTWRSRPVTPGMEIGGASALLEGPIDIPWPAEEAEVSEIRFVKSADLDARLASFLDQDFVVSIHSDRAGIRLDGLATPHDRSATSTPCAYGSVQLPPEGLPIVMGPEGPTTGGYVRAGFVAACDLPRLGRLSPGKKLRFKTIEAEDAVGSAVSWNESLMSRLTEINSIARPNFRRR